MARMANVEAIYMSDDPYIQIAEVAEMAAHQAGLRVEVTVLGGVPLLVGPPTVAKGQATENAQPIERLQKSIVLDEKYIITLYPGRYVVFQKDAMGNWRRRKTPRRNHYKDLRQALADIFEGIIWDRLVALKAELASVDKRTFQKYSHSSIKDTFCVEDYHEGVSDQREQGGPLVVYLSEGSAGPTSRNGTTNPDVKNTEQDVLEPAHVPDQMTPLVTKPNDTKPNDRATPPLRRRTQSRSI